MSFTKLMGKKRVQGWPTCGMGDANGMGSLCMWHTADWGVDRQHRKKSITSGRELKAGNKKAEQQLGLGAQGQGAES